MTTINEMKNLALFTLGEPDNIDFNDTSREIVQKVNRIYDISKQYVLSSYYWRFCLERVKLTDPVLRADTFTANDITDEITLNNGGLANDLAVTLTTTGTLPTPLVAGTIYYIVSSIGNNTSQLSLTQGGGGINILDAGIGTHTMTFTVAATVPYQYLYVNIPTDLLVFRHAYTDVEGRNPIGRYEFNADGFNCDTYNSNDKSIIFWYLQNTVEDNWPSYFVDYFKYKLAFDLCFNLTGDTDLLNLIGKMETKMLISAKNIDAKQVKTRTIKNAPYIAVRR